MSIKKNPPKRAGKKKAKRPNMTEIYAASIAQSTRRLHQRLATFERRMRTLPAQVWAEARNDLGEKVYWSSEQSGLWRMTFVGNHGFGQQHYKDKWVSHESLASMCKMLPSLTEAIEKAQADRARLLSEAVDAVSPLPTRKGKKR